MTERVVFILVGTRSPGNVGAVCRVAKAFRFPHVRLVTPRLTAPFEEARRLAHGAEDVLDAVVTFADLRAALEDCFRSAAATGRPRDWSRPVLAPGELAQTSRQTPSKLGVVLGPEDRGLTNEELAACDEIVSIPRPEGSSATLSLPAAATILAYELSRAFDQNRKPAGRSARSSQASRPLGSDELDALLGDLETTLSEIGFRPRPNAIRFRGSLRDFLARAQPTLGDSLVLRHVFAQVGKWRRRLASQLRREPEEHETR